VDSDDATATAGDGVANVNAAPTAPDPKKRQRARVKKILGAVASVIIVVGIFVFAIPKFADYTAVWAAIKGMTPLEIASLFVAMIFNLFTYWWANMAALPGLRLWPASVLTQTTTSVANTLPGGGAIAIGLTYEILKSWGFTGTNTALYVGVTGIWNIFVKLGLPVISIVILVATGQSSTAYLTAAVVGVIVLAIAVGLLAAIFRSEPLARVVGRGLGRVASFVSKPFRRGKGPITGLDDRAAKFRKDTIGLVERRWIRLTFFTILSQLALFFVLLLSLRHMGISEQEISAARVFAVFSFSRLLSAVPLTPGGVGVIDLGYVGGLTAGIPDDQKAAAVAAVLIFRLLTFGIQIPLGGFTYFIWLKNKSWRKDAPEEPVEGAEIAAGTAG
jgi:putative heme transporter